MRPRISRQITASVRLLVMGCIFLCINHGTAPTHAATDISVLLVSTSSDGGYHANGGSHAPAISANGRYIVFLSEASNLVMDDENGLLDVFVHDVWTRTTTLVSRNYDGGPANGEPSRPSISADGRYIVYSSDASNVVPDDDNEASDVFLYDRDSKETELISLNTDEKQGNKNSFTRRPSVSRDGRFVVFFSNSTNLAGDDYDIEDDPETNHVYLRDRLSGTTTLISKNANDEIGDNNSEYPSISADGSTIAFHSFATNLTDNKDNNLTSDVFLYDLDTITLTRISNTPDGWAGSGASDLAALSAHGNKVGFVSFAHDLLPPGEDTNNTSDIFIYSVEDQRIQRVSISSLGEEGNAISDVPSLSDDGRYVAFYSFADNLVPNDENECTEDTNKKRSCTDVFRHDTESGETIRVSLNTSGIEGNNDSACSGIIADGQAVVYYSLATNLVAGDTNNFQDIFVYSYRPLVRRYHFPIVYQNAP